VFRSFQIIIREFRCSLLKLLQIYDLVRFCKQGVVAAYHVVSGSVVESVPSQLHSLQQIPTQHDTLPQHLVYKNELNRKYVITLARNDETPW